MKRLAIHHLSTETRDADVVVIGSGVAGLEAALGLHGKKVALLSKGELGTTGSSPWAQGGVAAAMMGGNVSVELLPLEDAPPVLSSDIELERGSVCVCIKVDSRKIGIRIGKK